MAKHKNNGVAKTSDKAKVTPRQVELAQNFASFYTNDTIIEMGPWDCRFRIGHVFDNSPERQVVIQLADIRMSPQHAKRVNEILTSHIASYEKRFGRIPTKDGVGEPTAPELP